MYLQVQMYLLFSLYVWAYRVSPCPETFQQVGGQEKLPKEPN